MGRARTSGVLVNLRRDGRGGSAAGSVKEGRPADGGGRAVATVRVVASATAISEKTGISLSLFWRRVAASQSLGWSGWMGFTQCLGNALGVFLLLFWGLLACAPPAGMGSWQASRVGCVVAQTGCLGWNAGRPWSWALIREKRHDLHGRGGEPDGVVFLARQGDGGLPRVFSHIHRGLWGFFFVVLYGVAG